MSTRKTMKAYHLEAFGDPLAGLHLRKDAMPSPRHGDVVVRMRATSLNYRDLQVADGQLPALKPDLIPLSDGAGEVVAVGDEVYRVKPGDRVVASFHQTWIAGKPEMEFMRGMLGGNVDGVLAEYVLLDQLVAAEAMQLRPVIDRVFSFAQAVDAYRHLQARAHFGKVVITVD